VKTGIDRERVKSVFAAALEEPAGLL